MTAHVEAWGEVSSEVFLYQRMIIPLLLKLIRKCGAVEKSNCREMKKHSSCVVGCGTKADIILVNCPGPFPCPLLTVIFLTIFDLFHGPGLLRLLKVFSNRSCDDFWKATGETFSKGAPNTNTPRRE